MSKIKEVSDKIKEEVCQVFKGNTDVVDMVLACLFAGGHVLLEDVPGTGKTVLAKSVAKASGLEFSRIQCTPDLMPSDVTGSSVWLPDSKSFEFRAGPVMASIVLVDELNRATPRTQSALLECMAEGQVSVDGVRHSLDKPFFVLATENPVESEGTFPLPEAQKDRFMMTLSMGYPSDVEEAQIITAQRSLVHPVENVKAVVSKKDILEAMEEAVEVHVDDAVLAYLIALAKASREDMRIAAGVSPRGSIALYKACQAYAAVNGRTFVTPEDVKLLALPVFRKRIILTSDSLLKGYDADKIIRDIILQVPIPAFKAHV
ncbi:MoxR-like ATPase [Treponema bryantii]|jgi:MoxR-like ATPase|uniref:MoxR-like ATPase n=1 Tax=Treponema bryantii TaxID=163 RepID=A0A1I3J505_9SPIR|nr:MoxR family ATPase [Treponema bryantii]SFI55269.1 MoxR-like ATPase [Treponema bryantii]